MTPRKITVDPPRIALGRVAAAAALDVSPSYFDDRIRPHLRAIRPGGQVVLFAVRDLEEWALANATPTLPGAGT